MRRILGLICAGGLLTLAGCMVADEGTSRPLDDGQYDALPALEAVKNVMNFKPRARTPREVDPAPTIVTSGDRPTQCVLTDEHIFWWDSVTHRLARGQRNGDLNPVVVWQNADYQVLDMDYDPVDNELYLSLGICPIMVVRPCPERSDDCIPEVYIPENGRFDPLKECIGELLIALNPDTGAVRQLFPGVRPVGLAVDSTNRRLLFTHVMGVGRDLVGGLYNGKLDGTLPVAKTYVPPPGAGVMFVDVNVAGDRAYFSLRLDERYRSLGYPENLIVSRAIAGGPVQVLAGSEGCHGPLAYDEDNNWVLALNGCDDRVEAWPADGVGLPIVLQNLNQAPDFDVLPCDIFALAGAGANPGEVLYSAIMQVYNPQLNQSEDVARLIRQQISP